MATLHSTQEQSSQSISIARLLRILREKKWIIIGLALLGLGVAIVQSVLAVPQYRATATILRQTASLDRALFGTQIFQVGDESRALVTAANLIKLDQVTSKVKEELGSSRPLQSLKGMITSKPNSSANTIAIVAEGPDPVEAAEVANAFAHQFIVYRQQADRAILASARAEVEAELESMTSEEIASTRGQTLSQKVEELSVLESMQTGGYEMVEEAIAPNAAFNKHATRDGVIGLVLGLVLGLAVAALLHLFDRRIKDEEVFEAEFGAPIIARIPKVGERWHGSRRRRSSAPVGFKGQGVLALESFRTLRSNLKYFEVGRELGTILVTSSLPREGKTVTAINLSISLAMSGVRVVLLEADLRRPMLGTYLGLDGRRGFTNLLSDSGTVTDVVQVVEVAQYLPNHNGRETGYEDHHRKSSTVKDLLCIPAGPLPPNPAELLAMPRTADVLKRLRAICDCVVIDGAPLLLVSDALELASDVDGVILVARLGHTRIEDAHNARRSLERIGVKPLGLVLSGVGSPKSYYRQYGDYYAKA